MQSVRLIIVISLGFVLFGLTRLVTWLAQNYFMDLIVKNPAAVFGGFENPYVVSLVVAIGFLLLARLVLSPIGTLGTWGVMILLVGGLSNLYDRLVHGGVIDFIPLGTWSTFNLADVEIILGAVLLIFDRPVKPSLPPVPLTR